MMPNDDDNDDDDVRIQKEKQNRIEWKRDNIEYGSAFFRSFFIFFFHSFEMLAFFYSVSKINDITNLEQLKQYKNVLYSVRALPTWDESQFQWLSDHYIQFVSLFFFFLLEIFSNFTRAPQIAEHTITKCFIFVGTLFSEANSLLEIVPLKDHAHN